MCINKVISFSFCSSHALNLSFNLCNILIFCRLSFSFFKLHLYFFMFFNLFVYFLRLILILFTFFIFSVLTCYWNERSLLRLNLLQRNWLSKFLKVVLLMLLYLFLFPAIIRKRFQLIWHTFNRSRPKNARDILLDALYYRMLFN